ncbi:MAG: cation diffusion facilitator family transporter, partial [Muribaculaceae bacterium]|nr:cation diffusion facilitator family transporter [Muribaculaceae bacterium]
METREKQIYRITLVGSVVNAVLVALKFVAGVVGHSSAMIADAVHSLSDFATDVVVIGFVRVASKPEDSDHAHGHGKYETLASVIVGVMLVAVGVGLGVEGVMKTIGFFKGEELETPNWWALGAALVSVVAKEWLYRYTVHGGARLNSPALVSNAWHHRSDAYTSLATLAGIAGSMLLGPRWRVLDPLAATLVSGFIVWSGWEMIKPGLDELLEKSLSRSEQTELGNIIESTPGVKAYHHLRTRRIGPHRALSVHAKMDPNLTLKQAHEIASDVEQRIRKRFGDDTYITGHMERYMAETREY